MRWMGAGEKMLALVHSSSELMIFQLVVRQSKSHKEAVMSKILVGIKTTDCEYLDDGH